MSVEIEPYEFGEDGKIRIRIDRDGERAVSDRISPRELINKVLDAILPEDPKEETSD